MTQWMPQTSDNLRPDATIGESATIGGCGRSRDTRSPVEPDEVQHTMAARSSVSATWRAAAAMASAPVRFRFGMQDVERRQIHRRVAFHFLRDAVHGRDRLDRILAGGGFRRQHHRVGAVEDRGGDVGDFGARRYRACDHQFQHLRGDDHRLAGLPAGARHFLLHAGHFFQRHLDAEVAARHHQGIGEVEDFGEPRHRLRLLDLGHHRGAAAGDLLGLGDVFRPLDEGQRHPIDAGIERGLEIGQILGRHGGERDQRVGQAHALAVRDFAADLDMRDDALRARRGRDKAELAVVDQELVARLDGGENLWMRQLHARCVAGRRVGIEHEFRPAGDLG